LAAATDNPGLFLVTDQIKALFERLQALSPVQLAQISAMLTRIERQVSKPVSQIDTNIGHDQSPKPIQGAHNLPQWKRRILCARPLYELPSDLVQAWTLRPGWPLDRMVHHPDLCVRILNSSTYLEYARIKRTQLTQEDTDLLTEAANSQTSRLHAPWPLDVIPQARAHQQSSTYRWMRISPELGPLTGPADYPIPRDAQALPAVDVTRLRQWLLILGQDGNTVWALTGKHRQRLVLRTAYFAVIQDLTVQPIP